MSSLSSTAEDILRLVKGPRLHHDPKVHRQILITDIENVMERSEIVADLRSENKDLDYEVRQLRRKVSDLEDELEDIE